MKAEEMKALLADHISLRQLLFPKGYLFTDDENIDEKEYPFYGEWKKIDFFNYKFLIHPKQNFYISKNERNGMALVGHAFDPVDPKGSISEEIMLSEALLLYEKSESEFTELFNRWTGLFALFVFDNGKLRLYGDPAGMYMAFYGSCNGKRYCSSHTNLLGDVCGLQFDEYVERLINYRFYSLFGKALPGDLSPYKQFKRLIPNHFAEFGEDDEWTVKRFFPTDENSLVELRYDEIIDRSAGILSRSMQLIHQKWNRAAISLTGGCDSKTTLSCTNGAYDKYDYFSYISSDSEQVDAVAAKKICDMIGVSHKTYEISNNDEDYHDISSLRAIMEYNSGNIGKTNANDVRKRAFFLNQNDFDVEVKSWVSEIVRAYYHKRFAKKSFPAKLTPKYATSLYKVFITDRKLVHDTEKIFADFLKKYYSDESFNKIPWYDLFFWEFRMSSWNGLVITGEQQIAYDIAIPYNNRVLLQLLLSTPVEKRVKDEPHWDIMRKMNRDIADCGISVTNIKHTNRRAKFEKLYLELSSKLPF